MNTDSLAFETTICRPRVIWHTVKLCLVLACTCSTTHATTTASWNICSRCVHSPSSLSLAVNNTNGRCRSPSLCIAALGLGLASQSRHWRLLDIPTPQIVVGTIPVAQHCQHSARAARSPRAPAPTTVRVLLQLRSGALQCWPSLPSF